MSAFITLFCRVVDNYGDIGVAWRLARQLQSEYLATVTLWVDDLAAFARIEPTVDAFDERQLVSGVHVLHWPINLEHDEADPRDVMQRRLEAAHGADTDWLGDLVIELFACETSALYEEAMLARQRLHAQTPQWVNLEYLSAEEWVEAAHNRPSLLANGLQKRFYFPGFTARTGGLIRERDIPLGAAVNEESAEIRVFGFGYDTPQANALWNVMPVCDRAVAARIPHGVFPRVWSDGVLTINRVGFVPQSTFDSMLAGNDLNWIRGEDSFVRAQLAGVPVLWHIYPQADAAHMIKLEAWMARYCDGLSNEAAAAFRHLHRLLNNDAAIPTDEQFRKAWLAYVAQLPQLKARAKAWKSYLCNLPQLAAGLVELTGKPL
jgi:uncharacterized repeat protein (TIGR03837 family)